MSGDRKIYVCPNCGQEHSGVATGWEDGGGDDGEQLTPVFDCFECGSSFSADEGFWGWEMAEDNPSSRA
jgi:hypothetical protein